MPIEERSFRVITAKDLKELQELSLKERERFFERNPRYKIPYYHSLIAIALCQGAALHYIDRRTGVKDFDIWYFYIENDCVRYPYRALKEVDSRLDKFGIHPGDVKKRYKGRRVGLMGRAIKNDIVERNMREPIRCIRDYLKEVRTKTARELAKKAVIGLWPETILGEKIWPVTQSGLNVA